MAANKQKAPVRKQTAKKTVKIKAEPTVKKKVTKAAVVPKAKQKLQGKAKAKDTAKVTIKVKAKGKKTVAAPQKKSVLPKKKTASLKPGRKGLAAKKSAIPEKGSAVAPADRFRGLKSMLIAKRDALLKEAKQEIQKYVSGENRQLVDTAIDEADWAAVEISEDINLKRLSAQRQLLNDVNECLRKLNEDTYGICEDCGEEISEKRLHVIPTATLCIDCKEQREKMAVLEQDTEI